MRCKQKHVSKIVCFEFLSDFLFFFNSHARASRMTLVILNTQHCRNVLLFVKRLVVWNVPMLHAKSHARHNWTSRVLSLASPVKTIMAPLKPFSRIIHWVWLAVWSVQHLIYALEDAIWPLSKRVPSISVDYNNMQLMFSSRWAFTKLSHPINVPWKMIRRRLYSSAVAPLHYLAQHSWVVWDTRTSLFTRSEQIWAD